MRDGSRRRVVPLPPGLLAECGDQPWASRQCLQPSSSQRWSSSQASPVTQPRLTHQPHPSQSTAGGGAGGRLAATQAQPLSSAVYSDAASRRPYIPESMQASQLRPPLRPAPAQPLGVETQPLTGRRLWGEGGTGAVPSPQAALQQQATEAWQRRVSGFLGTLHSDLMLVVDAVRAVGEENQRIGQELREAVLLLRTQAPPPAPPPPAPPTPSDAGRDQRRRHRRQPPPARMCKIHGDTEYLRDAGATRSEAVPLLPPGKGTPDVKVLGASSSSLATACSADVSPEAGKPSLKRPRLGEGYIEDCRGSEDHSSGVEAGATASADSSVTELDILAM